MGFRFGTQKSNFAAKSPHPSQNVSRLAYGAPSAQRSIPTPYSNGKSIDKSVSSNSYNDISYRTVGGSLNLSRSQGYNGPQMFYMQETVKYEYSMRSNSFAELKALNEAYLDMQGRYKGVEISVSKLVAKEYVRRIISHYNSHLATVAFDRGQRDRITYYEDQWHRMPNELVWAMIVEWCRPTSHKNFENALMDVLEQEIPQKYPITIGNFCSHYHAKILGLIDLILKMREIFGSGDITPKMRMNLPVDGWGTDGRPGYARCFFAALGKRDYTRILNICGGKDKIKSFTVLTDCFEHVESVLQTYRNACVEISQMHDDMEPSTRIDSLTKAGPLHSNMGSTADDEGRMVKYGSKFPSKEGRSQYVSRFNHLDDTAQSGIDDSMLSDSDYEPYTDKVMPHGDDSDDGDDNNADNDFDFSEVYDDKTEDSIAAMNDSFQSEKSARTAIKDIFRGYCVTRLAYGSCSDGAKCTHCHSAAGRSICLKSVKMIADQTLAEHAKLKEHCEDVDPDYKQQLLARSQQKSPMRPTMPMKKLEAPPRHIPKAMQRNVAFQK